MYGAYEEVPRPGDQTLEGTADPVPPRPAYGPRKDGRDDRKQVLLSLGGSNDGGLPLRMGGRGGNTSDSTETPVAIEACLALGLEGVRGIVADSKAYCRRTLGWCLEKQVGLRTLVPRTCAVRQALEVWGRQQGPLPLLFDKPGRTRHEAPRRGPGQSSLRCVEGEDSDGRVTLEALRFVVVHASQLAQQAASAYATAQAKEAERVAEHIRRIEARRLACEADAEAAMAEYPGRGQGRRGRKPRPWHSHRLPSRVEAIHQRQTRPRRGRPPQAEQPSTTVWYRLVVAVEGLEQGPAEPGWFVLATTVNAAECSDAEILQAYEAQNTPVEPGLRWIKNPAAISPVWLENPERIAALAMLTVVGLLV